MSLSLRGKEFNNEILGISVTCYKDENNMLWFVGPEVGKILGYKDPNGAIQKHVKPKHKRIIGTGTNNPANLAGLQSPVLHPHTKLISEPGFWSLAVRCNLPAAEDFREWICEDVLPSIREQGYYALPGVLEAIKSIEHREVYRLCGSERREFKGIVNEMRELLKDHKKAQSGKKGGSKTQETIKKSKNENTNLKEQVSTLEDQVEELTQEIDAIKSGIAEILADDY